MNKIQDITTFQDVGQLLQPVAAYDISAVDLIRNRKAMNIQAAVEDAIEALEHNDSAFLLIRITK